MHKSSIISIVIGVIAFVFLILEINYGSQIFVNGFRIAIFIWLAYNTGRFETAIKSINARLNRFETEIRTEIRNIDNRLKRGGL